VTGQVSGAFDTLMDAHYRARRMPRKQQTLPTPQDIQAARDMLEYLQPFADTGNAGVNICDTFIEEVVGADEQNVLTPDEHKKMAAAFDDLQRMAERHAAVIRKLCRALERRIAKMENDVPAR
jgi:hypothetical protein